MNKVDKADRNILFLCAMCALLNLGIFVWFGAIIGFVVALIVVAFNLLLVKTIQYEQDCGVYKEGNK